MIELHPIDSITLPVVRYDIASYHYLGTYPDPRTRPYGYTIIVKRPGWGGGIAGYLIFGRPESTRCYPWYGSLEDTNTGRSAVTRWQILNLSRVLIKPKYQKGGDHYTPDLLPGFTDRKGVFRSTLATTAIRLAIARIGFDYLLKRPPVYLDEPYEITWLLSYCNTALHRVVIYKAVGFELYRANKAGIQTYRIPLPHLTADQHAAIHRASEHDPRANRYRQAREDARRQPRLPLF